MKIVSLQAQNILRLKAIHIQADGKNVTLEGVNGSGKTSVLRCIEMGLGGKTLMAEKPIHDGATEGKIVLDLGDFVVTRTFGEGGKTNLVVSSKEGAKYPSPQAILDGLIGKLTFDPLEFSRMEPAKQNQTLKDLVGLDFTQIELAKKVAYDSRTLINRDIKALEVKLAGKASHIGLPSSPVSVSDLMVKLEEARQINSAIEKRRNAYAELKAKQDTMRAQVAKLKKEIEALTEEGKKNTSKLEQEAEFFADDHSVDLAPISEQINTADTVNQKLRENAQLAKDEAAMKDLTKKADAFSDIIVKCDADKQKALADAKFPLPGLGFSESGVTLNGHPFEQASQAERIQTSAAIGIALNPKLRVLMIRDASLIDKKGMRVLADMAQTKDCQLWLERVSDKEEVSVLIEE